MKILPYGAALLAMFFWAASFIVIKIAYLYMGAYTLTFLRLVAASLLMPILYYISPQRDRIKRKHILHLLLLSFFEPFLYFIGESKGMLYVPASYGAIIISLIPLVTPIVAWILIKEPITKWGIAGTIISFSGVALLVSGNADGTVSLKGLAFLFLAVLAAVGYGISLRQIAHEYKPVTIVMVQTFFGMLYFLPLFLIFESRQFFTAIPPWEAFLPVLGLAIFCTCGAFLLFTFAIRQIGLNNANILSNMIPVFTTVLAFFILKEAVPVTKAVGILIVVGGLFLSQYPLLVKAKKRRHLLK
ncbi:MAG: DMT family transporter [Candidatus Cloacimonetes bacterium]|nr:DMT family transporter [Candidatus Cloacimonadota bacterium]